MSLSRLGEYLDQMLTAANDARRLVEGMSKLAVKETLALLVECRQSRLRPQCLALSLN